MRSLLAERVCVVVQQHGNGATCESRFGGVCPAGENDRNPCAQHNSGKLRATQIFKLLGEHVAALEVGHNQDVGLTGDR